MARRRYTAEQVDAAVQALGDATRFGHAQEIVTHAAPNLQRVLAAGARRGRLVRLGPRGAGRVRPRSQDDPDERLRAVRTLVAEETRLGMLVGVAVGLELAEELANPPTRRGAVPMTARHCSTIADVEPKGRSSR